MSRICGAKISSECRIRISFAKRRPKRESCLPSISTFGEIVALSGQKNVSVVLFRLRNTRTPHVIERLKVALQETKHMLESGAIIVVEENRLRVRRLPLRK
jgi:hypothetical protein